MYNPNRRNRNIGTAKQGYKRNSNNKMEIPYSKWRVFYENLKKHQTIKKLINGHEFLFIIEQTRPNYKHACSTEDIERIISYIPKQDYGDLKFIILRQPNRKEELLSSAWGRYDPLFAYKDEIFPAIILEAVNYTQTLINME